MIPESFKSKDTIFHYCKSTTAIEHILANMQIRLSPRKNSYDPVENMLFRISQSIAITDDTIENRTEKGSQEISRNISEKSDTIKQACFCKNNNSKLATVENYGFLKPRIWDQYGDRYEGVCIALNKKRLTENPIIKLKGDLKYMTYSELQIDYLEIDKNYLDRNGIGQYNSELMNIVDTMFLRKHIDYRDEREYRICAFSQNEYEYINIKSSINGLVVIPELINRYTYDSLIAYSKDLKIPLLYLTLTPEGVNITREPHSDFFKIQVLTLDELALH